MGLWNCFSKIQENTNDQESSSSLSLKPLTPEYDKNHHNSYVDRINAAFKISEVRNIALSGNYGVGKSSILQEVANQHKHDIVEISLSTLAPMKTTEGNTDETKLEETTTNRIQQEIVKQLLYRLEPQKAPHSRFQRIERFNLVRELCLSLVIGIAAVPIFILMSWTDKISKAFLSVVDLGLYSHLIILAFTILIAFGIRWLTHGRMRISNVSAGAATISLDDKSGSYFDQYLDEIVYFFEVSKKNIVIFEDIDRFEDSHIFETLRSLNTLLNSAPQIKETIRFIYAIKDSIFDLSNSKQTAEKPHSAIKDAVQVLEKLHSTITTIEDAAQDAVQQTARTKFFDLIIPVVPFITHRSARDLIKQILEDELYKNINPELIKIAARYVPDMRLLKNVRNEFIIFREEIFTDDSKQLNLSESDLFAMMLYKSTHLADFELIRLGESKLDKIYDASRKLITENINRIEKEIMQHKIDLENLSRSSIQKRSEHLGLLLITYINRVLKCSNQATSSGQLKLNNERLSIDDLKSVDFWSDYTNQKDKAKLYWTPHNYNQTLTFELIDIEEALGTSLSPSDWKAADKKEFSISIDKKKNELEFLRSADIYHILKQSTFTLDAKSLDTIIKENLSKELAYQLIKSGYINRNFTLYTSTFHDDNVSPAAQNFIIHNVDRNVMDEHFLLTDEDIKAIIKECGQQSLSEPCLYNISILNYLLRNYSSDTDIMIRALMQFGEKEKQFLQLFLNGKNEYVELIKKLTPETEETLHFLINGIELDDQKRLNLIDLSLENLDSETHYNIDDSVSEYLETHYSMLSTLIRPSDKTIPENITYIFADASIRIPELKLLSETMQQAFVCKNLYTITKENLIIALRNNEILALDIALEINEDIYNYLLTDIKGYLDSINGFSKSVNSNKHFIKIIKDIYHFDPDYLDDIINQASDTCIVEDLKADTENTWQTLAKLNRFPATFNNINNYINSVGSIDENLEQVLINSKEISHNEQIEEEHRVELAKKILNANKAKLTNQLRVKLSNSLKKFKYYIPAIDLPVEKGELYALLLGNNLISDSEKSYTHLLETDWSTRESYIHVSKKFVSYITPELLKSDLGPLLKSKKISLSVKQSIVERADEFINECSNNCLVELAKFSIEHNHNLSIDVVEKMANSHIKDKDIILLLSPHLNSTMDSEQLFRILGALKNNYPQLISTGKDKPKIPKTAENQKLINTLQALQIVSSFKDIGDGLIQIFKRHK
ncbi:YobI family P-loop NTPase [Marinomonas colpomeniae]|uniref:DNA-binding protein n=1 Tax=Marinomonas colpomeniae TaxID=2774408 RepID=A0ABR8P1M2_9GAMM|nr:DNA-binding protein [Marinomonas colpomeniae]MBD5771197.1 DNA-binding protein [Marinomonas colpomeniae]